MARRARARGPGGVHAVDALFEFDAPQLFVDLSAARVAAADVHDPWFDRVHPEHSKSSEELARELAATMDKVERQQHRQQQLEQHQHQHSHQHSHQHQHVRQDKRKTSASRRKQALGHGHGDDGWSPGKENRSADGRGEHAGGSVLKLGSVRRRKYPTLREARAAQEPFQVAKIKTTIKSVAAPVVSSGEDAHKSTGKTRTGARRPLGERTRAAASNANIRAAVTDNETQGEEVTSTVKPQKQVNTRKRVPSVSNTTSSGDLHDLQALLARHNKKFKTKHTYEPRQHSVRDVKQWERETHQSFYALSAQERVAANKQISLWLKQRRELAESH